MIQTKRAPFSGTIGYIFDMSSAFFYCAIVKKLKHKISILDRENNSKGEQSIRVIPYPVKTYHDSMDFL